MKKIFLSLIVSFLLISGLTLTSHAQGFSFESDNFPNITQYDVVIYPNPVIDEKFFVKSDNVIKSVEVLNVIGQTIKKVNNKTGLPYNIFVQLPDCEKGMYMVRITFENNDTLIKKILIK